MSECVCGILLSLIQHYMSINAIWILQLFSIHIEFMLHRVHTIGGEKKSLGLFQNAFKWVVSHVVFLWLIT